MCSSKIEDLLKKFHLDNRASKRELDIAYETLTKNISGKEFEEYRQAYEFLVFNFYGLEETVLTNTILNDNNIKEDKNLLNELPPEIQSGLEYIDSQVDGGLTDDLKYTLSTQQVNVALLFKSLAENKRKFFNMSYWTKQDINNVLQESCLNPINYMTIMFEISPNKYCTNPHIEKAKIFNFLQNIKKIHEENGTCKFFQIYTTLTGVLCSSFVEESVSYLLAQFLEDKCKIEKWNFNVTF